MNSSVIKYQVLVCTQQKACAGGIFCLAIMHIKRWKCLIRIPNDKYILQDRGLLPFPTGGGGEVYSGFRPCSRVHGFPYHPVVFTEQLPAPGRQSSTQMFQDFFFETSIASSQIYPLHSVLVLVLIKDDLFIKRMLTIWNPCTRVSFLHQSLRADLGKRMLSFASSLTST